MTSGELLKLFRSEMSDQIAPFLWSDVEVYSYIDDAQKMFCRKTDGLTDATTTAVTQLAIASGASYVPTHKSILKLRSVTRQDTGEPIEVVNFEDLATRGWRYDGTSGPIKALVIGEEEHKARTYPVANANVVLKLLVFRMPLTTIESDDDLEIFEEHHRHLLHWVKCLAYSKQDSETTDKNKAIEFEGRFLSYCAQAQLETRRKAHKHRTVEYGGI